MHLFQSLELGFFKKKNTQIQEEEMGIYGTFINSPEFYQKIYYKKIDYFLDLAICPSIDLDKSYKSYLFTTCFHYSRDKCF